MARSTGEIPSSAPISPYQTPPAGVPSLGGPAPLSYAGQPIPPAPAAKAGPTPAGLINAFKRRWVLGTFIGLMVAVAFGVILWMSLPGGKHEARGLIDLPTHTLDIASRREQDFENYRKNQIFILKTRDLLNRTVNDPAVASLDMIKNNEDPVRMLEECLSVSSSSHSILAITLKGNNLDEMRTIVDSLMKRYVDQITAEERGHLMQETKKLERLKEEITAEIQSLDGRAKMIARSSGVTGSDGQNNTQDQLTRSMAELEADIRKYDALIILLESQLRVAEEQLGKFKVTDKTLDTLRANGIDPKVLEKLKLLKDREFDSRQLIVSELTKLLLKSELVHLRSTILNNAQMPETQQPNIPEGEVTFEINKDSRIVRLQFELDELKRIYQKEKDNSTDPLNSPLLKGLDEKVQTKEKEVENKRAEIRSTVVAAIKSKAILFLQTEVQRVEKDLAVARETRDSFKEKYETLRKNRSGAAENHLELTQLRKEIENKRETLNKVELRLQENLVEMRMDSRATIREVAQPLPNNNFNKKLLMSGGLGVATFFCVILVVAFLEWRSRRVDGVDQVVDELGMRIIGTVPLFPNRASIKAAAEAGGANWRFSLNESINSTRTMLLHTARSQSMQVVMVTSATQGEGKTSVTSQLASSMATAGMRTLIVDCDLRNPSIHKLFDLTLNPGVSEILTQDADPTDAIQPTTVPNLWVIPAGQCSNRVISALAQGHPLETLFNRLRGQFDFVIVDSCPVLPVADALLIGQHVDAVLFSIMQDISQIPKVILASEKLTQLNIPLLGAVVNGIKQDVYSYGYNYVKQLPA